jgi:hypothetical protein
VQGLVPLLLFASVFELEAPVVVVVAAAAAAVECCAAHAGGFVLWPKV